MATHREQGMQLMDGELARLVNEGIVAPEEAYMRALDKGAFEGQVRPVGDETLDGPRSTEPAPRSAWGGDRRRAEEEQHAHGTNAASPGTDSIPAAAVSPVVSYAPPESRPPTSNTIMTKPSSPTPPPESAPRRRSLPGIPATRPASAGTYRRVASERPGDRAQPPEGARDDAPSEPDVKRYPTDP